MKVKVGKRMYQDEPEGVPGTSGGVAKEQVPRGIYAVEKSDYAELRNDRCTSTTQLKAMIRAFKSPGI